MDAVEYLKTLKRICKECGPTCPDCPAIHICWNLIQYATPEKITKAVEDVEAWRKEHPTKTRQSEFLKMFPNACMTEDVIAIDPCIVEDHPICVMPKGMDCRECRAKYWTEEIE